MAELEQAIDVLCVCLKLSALEKLLEQLKDEEALRQLYNAMKVKDFDQLVEQVMYVSNMLGRMQDG